MNKENNDSIKNPLLYAFIYACYIVYLPVKLLKKLNPKSIRISLTNESAKLSSQVLDLAERAFVAGELVEDLPNTTRGHFKRGVL